MDPRLPNALPLPSVVQRDGEDYFQLKFSRNADPGFGSVGLQLSYDLSSWSDVVTTADAGVIVTDTGDTFGVLVRRRTNPSAYLRRWARP
jgi:hypothetical protein